MLFSEDNRKYIVAAFPSACGKTNLAMLKPALEGYDITCEGDDIAWMRFDSEGYLRAINPGKYLSAHSKCLKSHVSMDFRHSITVRFPDSSDFRQSFVSEIRAY